MASVLTGNICFKLDAVIRSPWRKGSFDRRQYPNVEETMSKHAGPSCYVHCCATSEVQRSSFIRPAFRISTPSCNGVIDESCSKKNEHQKVPRAIFGHSCTAHLSPTRCLLQNLCKRGEHPLIQCVQQLWNNRALSV